MTQSVSVIDMGVYNSVCFRWYEEIYLPFLSSRVILFRVIPLLGVLLGSVHSGSYQYRPTGLYFEEWMYIFKIKTNAQWESILELADQKNKHF